ncbi:response regulator transcription factor [Candidatus Enterococcus willemsii]|nr:response regulator transcription factor [Enterococcus sp. CU12B]
MDKKILLIEDDTDLAKMIAIYLQREGFLTQIVTNGSYALEEIATYEPDLILLDLMLPGIDGLEILRQVRTTLTTPIIILSAKETEIDRVLGLKLGADDYVTKPFSIKELVARVESLFRRIDFFKPKKQPRIQFNDVSIDCLSKIVTKNRRVIELTAKEYQLLLFLIEHPHQVFSKEQLYQQVWAFDQFGDTNTVAVHIQKIREKLLETHSITTVRGAGYRFDGDVQ